VLPGYREIVALDFEFVAEPGECPVPVCCVAHELRSGRRFRLWVDEFGPAPPFASGDDVLTVAFFASAELGCYLALDWPMPTRILDLYTEFRCRTNGLETPGRSSLLGALTYFGLDHIGVVEKKQMRDLIATGGPWTADEREAILDYCEGDVEATVRLLSEMAPGIDLPRALLRGRYMAAVAVMERNGVPIDVETLELFRRHGEGIQHRLIAEIDADYGVFEDRSFRAERFEDWLIKRGIPWPRLESGALSLGDGTFREMAKAHPAVSPLRELRSSLADLRRNALAIGSDGRNRTLLSPFRSKTGRNQPSNSRFIFGPAVWIRGLIKPPAGHAIAYVDWSQQEFGIAAALSGDANMISAYASGDPYLTFAKLAGAAPADATRTSHKSVREQFKQCVLGVQYGMGPESLARRLGQPIIVARNLLRAHKEAFPRFWVWSEAAVNTAMLYGSLSTRFGWTLHIGEESNPRSLQNYPMQANGAEMLRIACCLATERGIKVCAPVHDAVLICAPLDRIEADEAAMRMAMKEASAAVLAGFELGSDAHVVRYPDRYMDDRGRVMWDRVTGLVTRASRPAEAARAAKSIWTSLQSQMSNSAAFPSG
jgi:hypothetical protein